MKDEDLRAAAMVGAATAVADIARRLGAARVKVPHGWLPAFDAAEIIVATTDVSEMADRVVSMRRVGAGEVSRG